MGLRFLSDKRQTRVDTYYERKLDREAEARLIALACSDPPDGRTRWTLRLLADELVALDAVEIDLISPETVRKTLTKNELQLHRSKQWVIPPEKSTDFVFHMENVLSLYQEPYDPDRPFVWFDEHPTQLVEQVREPQSASLAQVEREDYHFKPVDTKNLFLATEPLDGWRAISVTDRRMMEDWVTFMQQLNEEHYPDVESLRVVLDNPEHLRPGRVLRLFAIG